VSYGSSKIDLPAPKPRDALRVREAGLAANELSRVLVRPLDVLEALIQDLPIHGFGNEVCRAGLVSTLDRLGVLQPSQHDDRYALGPLVLAELCTDREPIDVRQNNVQQDDIWHDSAHYVNDVRAVGYLFHEEVVLLQCATEQGPLRRIVVDD
jgi:hypothetical protein